MNNEIGRKITSLTLMTIMLASAFAVGAPSVLPQAAAANANLFVSAENSQFQNHISGPQVTEVVVIDSDIKDTDKGKGEPDVTINGNKLRMAQATDGNWYGYFADLTQAQLADSVQAAIGKGGNGTGLDFGMFCTSASATTLIGPSFTTAQAVALPRPTQTTEGSQGTTSPAACAGKTTGATLLNGVVRENKTLNHGISGTVSVGQIGILQSNLWPFIQLYNLNPTGNVVVQYNKGGGVQSTTLTFDTAEQFAKLEQDRTSYTRGSQVDLTLTNSILNIDPTDEDSWTFGTTPSNATMYYQIFNEDGTAASNSKISSALTGNTTALMFNHNDLIKMNMAAQGGNNIVDLQDNADTIVNSAGNINAGKQAITNQPLTFTETAPNTGVFGTYDENDISNLIVDSSAARGKSASLDFNQRSQSIVVGFGSATVSIQPTDAEWNAGEKIPVTVVDSDSNKNSRSDEKLYVRDANAALIPSLRIGSPFTLGANGTETTGTNRALTFYGATLGAGPIVNQTVTLGTVNDARNVTVQKFSDRALLGAVSSPHHVQGVIVTYGKTIADLKKTVYDTTPSATTRLHGFDYFNYDIRGIPASGSSLSNNNITAYLAYGAASSGNNIIGTSSTTAYKFPVIQITNTTSTGGAAGLGSQGLVSINKTDIINRIYGRGALPVADTDKVGVMFTFNQLSSGSVSTSQIPMVADFFSFGYLNDGVLKSDRINNALYRVEVEETGDNTSTFAGTLEYIMLNQLNILDSTTYNNLRTISNQVKFVVDRNLDDKDSPRVNYNDLGSDGVTTQVSAQQAAPTHSGVVSFDKPTYKKADTVIVTLDDQDLNTSPGLIDIYTVVNATRDAADETVGKSGLPTLSTGSPLGQLLYVTFDSQTWTTTNNACSTTLINSGIDTSLRSAGFTLVETGSATGIFTGTFEVPAQVCKDTTGTLSSPVNAMGLNMEVKYNDFRDASGQTTRVGDAAGIRANTGSVSLDRTVYPVPWGAVADFSTPTDDTAPNGRSIFPVHLTAIGTSIGTDSGKVLPQGNLILHIQVNDPDYDTSASGEDKIAENVTSTAKGPVKVTVSRGSSSMILGYAGGDTIKNGVIDANADNTDYSSIRQIGPITETAPSSGIFEFDFPVEYTDGPASTTCPATKTAGFDSLTTPGTQSTETTRFDTAHSSSTGNYCILQGDIVTVEYTDPADASGHVNTVTDSATFDLRNGALQSDKSVYIIGSDMILTLIEPDFDLDNQNAETYNLDLIEWDSDAATVTLGNKGGSSNVAQFDAEPSSFRETGDSTGIFQSVIKIPTQLTGEGQTGTGKKLNRGEEAVLEYTDWGPSGANFVGEESEKVNLTIFTSNFGATVELDQKVYSWTDKVYITVVAPDHNFDSNLIDTIGSTSTDPLKVATRDAKLTNYKLTETGTDTGIFTGEVILVGFKHDANGAAQNGGKPTYSLSATGSGPTGGYLGATNSDGVSVSYEFSEDETVVGSALVRWNIGEVSWLEASYPASGTGVVRVVDPDMNLNPEAVDNFDVNVWSDSDAGGISLTVTETNEATGIFEGTVFFTTTDSSSGHRLRVAEGDTVTAEYKDNTLPDPYTVSDELDITATSFIGTVVPPLERAPASNARVVDAFGNTLDNVSVDQQVQITADLTNGQDREQPFAYLVQVQDDNGVTVSLAWITGSLSAGQSFSPALSWVPSTSGHYTATVFVWESVDNPTALSPPVSVDITVS